MKTRSRLGQSGNAQCWTVKKRISVLYVFCVKNFFLCAVYLHLKGPTCGSSAGKCCSASSCCAARQNYLPFEGEAAPVRGDKRQSNILLLLGMGIFQYPVNVLNASTPLKPFLIQEYWAKCGKTTLFCRLFHFYIRGKIILGTWCFNCCEIHSILITERRIRVTAMFVHEHMMCYHLQLSFQLEYDSLILFYIKKNPKQNLQPSLKKIIKCYSFLKI